MPNEVKTTVTGSCSAADGSLLVPQGTTTPGSHVLVDGGQNKLILKFGYRSEVGGNAACVTGSALNALGGEGHVVSYRPIGTLERVFRDRRLLLQAAVSLLTFAGACLTAYTAWIKTNASTTATGWEQDTAAVALILAAGLSLLKLYKEITEL